ncbi:DNA adenine methylase [Plebeiibacterium sediminum]|uniref:Site-specific DNA-methyltransferase (adenine-specific) n=1 Tax=Plebeiibacterium sediminum TaxID=2992112 RepID=A0AAE3M6U3_9BACT|nr:Dam family site-specific DNA-(adenine-N6)-methyltransferase [Plebeiobacterium sediminum]MCW3788183.1 Dam family site-specific DNA-(adenine-N6)-methyltransferase [Plebeiobacterium sediminum]
MPFLKWPGGKRWLVPILKEVQAYNGLSKYYEPFLGGGAIFFSINSSSAHLSDSNRELINTYVMVRDYPEELLNLIQEMPQDKESYYKIRSTEYNSNVKKAAQFLYLNRLAFGGMYRVNLQGKFNVPYGGNRKVDILWTRNLIKNASEKLQGVTINCSDFESILHMAKKGDFVYCDPPYTVAHNLNGFQRYNENIFSWQDQVRLYECCFKAAKRGVKILVSNAAHESVKDLYKSVDFKVVNRYSGLSKLSASRKRIDEYLFLFNI